MDARGDVKLASIYIREGVINMKRSKDKHIKEFFLYQRLKKVRRSMKNHEKFRGIFKC